MSRLVDVLQLVRAYLAHCQSAANWSHASDIIEPSEHTQ